MDPYRSFIIRALESKRTTWDQTGGYYKTRTKRDGAIVREIKEEDQGIPRWSEQASESDETHYQQIPSNLSTIDWAENVILTLMIHETYTIDRYRLKCYGIFLVKSIATVLRLLEKWLTLCFYFLPTSVTPVNLIVVTALVVLAVPSALTNCILYPLYRLLFGTLYPAYASYKAVRTKNVKEYVKWMMYWIVFALFTCAETFTDVFFSWFPFYYEVKILMVIWLLSPATKGSSILYRKFVHPALCRREQEIDEYISKAKDQGYQSVLNLGTKGVNYATNVIMQTAIKNFATLDNARKLSQLASPRQPLSSVSRIRELTPDVSYVDHVDGPIEISSEEIETTLLIPKLERESPPLEETQVLRSRQRAVKKKATATKRVRSGTRRTRKRSLEKHSNVSSDVST